MTDNIQPLKIVKRNFNADTIEILEEALEMAKSGEICEIAIVAFKPNGDQLIRISPLTDTLRKIGALTQIQFDILSVR